MLVTTLQHGKEVFDRLLARQKIGRRWLVLDTETEARNGFPGKDSAIIIGRMQILVISACYMGESYCFATSHLDSSYPTPIEWLRLLVRTFKNTGTIFVFHYANYDVNVFWTEKMPTAQLPPIWCTMIGAWKANPVIDKGLKVRANLYGRFLSKTKAIDFSNKEQLELYAEEDVIQGDEMYQMQMYGSLNRPAVIERLAEDGSIVREKNPLPPGKHVIPDEDLDQQERLEMTLQEIPYLMETLDAEQAGFPFLVPRLEQIRVKVADDKKKALAEIFKIAGRSLNLRSPKQMDALFKELGIVSPVKTKKGAASFNSKAITLLGSTHSLLAPFKKYKALDKLQSVYVGNPEEVKDPKKKFGLAYYVQPDSTIRASANTVGAVTGRGTSNNPNLTQIPSAKDTYGIKSCFVAQV